MAKAGSCGRICSSVAQFFMLHNIIIGCGDFFPKNPALTEAFKCDGITETSRDSWCSADFENLVSYLLEQNEKKNQVFVMGILKIVIKIFGKSYFP